MKSASPAKLVYTTQKLPNEAALQTLLRNSLRSRGLKVEEGSKIGRGIFDLYVEDAVLIENKFHGSTRKPKETARPAGMQGRRYAISLGSQIVIVVLGYEAKPAQLPNKSQTLSVHGISGSDANRVELRFSLPYGAPSPSGEKEDRAVRQ